MFRLDLLSILSSGFVRANAFSRAGVMAETDCCDKYKMVFQKPILFLPWMVVYGSELVAGWATGISFLMLTGT